MRITVAVAAADADIAATALVEEFGAGCRVGMADGQRVELDVWVAPAPAPDPESVRSALSAWGVVDASVSAVREDPAWYTATREFHRPVEIGDSLRVRPPWEPASGGRIDVVIDPGMAFGSGQHATTKGCLEALCALPRAGVLDVGCGSGILAIAAAKLGFAPVRAIDLEPESVAATTANAAANAISVDVTLGRAGSGRIRGEDVLLANLTATALCDLAAAPPAPLPLHAVLSGMRGFELDAVHGAWARLGLSVERVLEDEGWCTSVLIR